MPLNIHQQTWRNEFIGIVGTYSEMKFATRNKTRQSNRNPNYVLPTDSDFVADFEIQARRALVVKGDWKNYWLFIEVYGFLTKSADSVDPELLEEIQWRVGFRIKKYILPEGRYWGGTKINRDAKYKRLS